MMVSVPRSPTVEEESLLPYRRHSHQYTEIWSKLVDVIDLTGLDIEFDHSCFDGLDEQLIYRPTEAFADICYDDAIYDEHPPHHLNSHPHIIPPPLSPVATTWLNALPEIESDDSDDSSSCHGPAPSYRISLDTSHTSDYEIINLDKPWPLKKPSLYFHFQHVVGLHDDDDSRSYISLDEDLPPTPPPKTRGLVNEMVYYPPPYQQKGYPSLGGRMMTAFQSTLPSRMLRTTAEV